MLSHRTSLSVFALAAAVVPLAHGQWTVTNLHPTTGTRSRAQGCADARQGGYAFVGGVDHAVTWTGTSATARDREMALAVACHDVARSSSRHTHPGSHTR